MTNSKIQTKSHLLFIDSLRALAALYVVIHHSVLQYYDINFPPFKSVDNYNLPALGKYVIKFFMFGNYSVDLFIVISGYSLMLSVTRNNYTLKGGVGQFFKRRVFRILPPYYFAMLISLLLIYFFIGTKTSTHWDVSIPVDSTDIITHLLLIHDFWLSKTPHINHAFWSIAVECRIYILFPVLVWIWRKSGMGLSLLFSLMIAIAGPILLYIMSKTDSDISFSTGVSPYIILFTLGMIAADLSFSESPKAIAVRKFYRKISPFFVILAMFVIFFGAKISIHFLAKFNISFFKTIHLDNKVFDVSLGVIFAILLFAFSESGKGNRKPFFGKVLSWKPLVSMGVFSYSIYLIHSPIIALISEYAITPLHLDRFKSLIVLVVVGAPLIILISYGFFYLFERPFLTAGKKTSPTSIEQETIINPAP